MSKVFVMTNQASGNQVWVYDRSDTGQLTPPTEAFMFPTGGDGIGGPTSTADPLFSQGSLLMAPDHQLIFAANAGTHDVTSFAVGPDGTLTWKDRAGSGGVQPTSMALHKDKLYVLNAGDSGVPTTGASICGLRLVADGKLRSIPGSARPIGGGASEIKFSPDGTRLIVISRSASTIDVYPVNTDGTLGGVRSTPTAAPPRPDALGMPAPFAGSFLGRDNLGRDVLAVCGLASRIALYGIGATGVAELIGDPTHIDGSAASCWTAVDNDDQPGFLFVSSAGGNEPRPDGTRLRQPGTIHGFTVNRPAGAPPSLTQAPDGRVPLIPPGVDGQPAPNDFLGGTDMAVSADSQFLYVIAGTENDVRDASNMPLRAWEIRGYRINGTKLDEITTEATRLHPPVGSQGIVAS